MSRAVIRVFFSTGLYKTAAIDDTVSVMELCRMIARKVKIEKGVEGVGNCTLFECRDMSETPWKASPFGTAYRIVGMDETPFLIVQSWVAENVAAISRFVIIVKELNPAVMRESIRIKNTKDLWRPSANLDAPLASDKRATLKKKPPTLKVMDEPSAAAAADTATTTTTTTGATSTPPTSPSSSDNIDIIGGDDMKITSDSSTLERSTEEEGKNQRKNLGVHSSLYLSKELECPQDLAAPCLDYVNKHVKARGIHVNKIEDLRSGAVMAVLAEELTKKRADPFYPNAANKKECLANWSTVLRILQESGCHMENDLPEDCYYGPQTTLVALVTLVAERFAENKRTEAVTTEVLTLLDKIQKQQDFIAKLEKELKDREERIFQKEIELEKREAIISARERQLGISSPSQAPDSPSAAAAAGSRSSKTLLPPPPAPMPAGYMKRIHPSSNAT